jgi:acetyl esterase/lipase
MGFSAGGHLTASTGTMFDAGKADATDPIDRVSSRPDFLVLGYPWLNAMMPNQKMLNYCAVMNATPEQCTAFEQYSPHQHVTAQTPPTFIYHTTDDDLVPVDASTRFYERLLAARVSAEMHLFARGKHGSGLGLGDPALGLWPTVLEAWLRGRGLLTPDPAVTAETQRLLAAPKPHAAGAPFAVDQSVRDLTADPRARAVLVRHLGEAYVSRLAAEGRDITLQSLALYDADAVSVTALAAIDRDLGALLR